MANARKWRTFFAFAAYIFVGIGIDFYSVAFAVSADTPKHFGHSSTFSVSGKQYQLLQRTNPKGAVIEQILISQDRMVISSDPKGSGSLETWQLITPKRAVLLHQPRNGQFRFMEVVEKAPKAILEMKFVLGAKGEYQMYAINSRPYKRLYNSLNYQDYVVGCRESEKQIQELAANVNEVVSTSDLRGNIKSQIMKPSCNAEPFAGESVNAMIDGIMKVATSDPQWDQKKMGSLKDIVGGQRSVDQKGNYLQCMRYYHLDTHASRIEAAFANYMSNVKTDGKFFWRIDCQHKDGDDYGSYDQKPGAPPDISFYKTAKDMLKKGNQSLADAYAETFFHEMVHYSLIADEDVVHDIENCCAVGGDQKACASLEKRVRDKSFGQQIENQVADVLGPNYAAYRELITEKYGPGANQVMDDFYSKGGNLYASYASQARCKNPSGKGLSAACEAEFKNGFAKIADDTFGSGPNSACTRSATRGFTARALETVGVSTSAGNSGAKGLDTMSASQVDSFCGAFSSFSKDLFSAVRTDDFRKNCPEYKKATTADWLTRSNSPILAWLTISSPAFAEEESVLSRLCKMSDFKQPFSYDLVDMDSQTGEIAGRAPNASDESRNHVNPDATKDSSQATSGNPLPSSSSGTNVGYSNNNNTSGPRRPDYSSLPSERERVINNELQRQDSVFGSRLSQLSDRIVKASVPSANAKSDDFEPSTFQLKNSDLQLPSPYAQNPSPGFSVDGRARTGLNSVSSSFAVPAASSVGVSGSPQTATASAAPASNSQKGTVANGKARINASAGNRGIAGVTGGVGATAAGASAVSAKQDEKNNSAEIRARRAFLIFLLGPFHRVKPELSRPSVRERLMHHKIQVVDDEGQVFGPQNYSDRLTYDINKKSLVQNKKASRGAASN